MGVIVKTDIETAKQYTGLNVYTKVGGKKHQVFFRVTVDDFTLQEGTALASSDKNIVMLKYEGSDNYLSNFDFSNNRAYIGVTKEVGNNFTEEDIASQRESLPSEVTLIIKVPEDYKNIRFLYNLSRKLKGVRFCGGSLFCFEGCSFGCCGRDVLEKQGISFNTDLYVKEGCACAMDVLSCEGLEFTTSSKAEKTSKRTSQKQSKSAMFSGLLYSNGKVAL